MIPKDNEIIVKEKKMFYNDSYEDMIMSNH